MSEERVTSSTVSLRIFHQPVPSPGEKGVEGIFKVKKGRGGAMRSVPGRMILGISLTMQRAE